MVLGLALVLCSGGSGRGKAVLIKKVQGKAGLIKEVQGKIWSYSLIKILISSRS